MLRLSDRGLQIEALRNMASLPVENRLSVLSPDVRIVLEKLFQTTAAEHVIEQNLGVNAGSLESNRPPPSVSGVLTRTFSSCFGITTTLYADVRGTHLYRAIEPEFDPTVSMVRPRYATRKARIEEACARRCGRKATSLMVCGVRKAVKRLPKRPTQESSLRFSPLGAGQARETWATLLSPQTPSHPSRPTGS